MLNKIYTIEEIIDLARRLNEEGKRIVLTHGVFDLMHLGHAYLLEQSKNYGDILIVGIDSDRAVKFNKGSYRPILSDEQRALLVLYHKSVDFVFIIDFIPEDTKFGDLYRNIKPHILTIGSRFGFTDRIRKRSEKLGIKLIQIENNYPTTTDIIEKIIDEHK